MLQQGCWTPLEGFAVDDSVDAGPEWRAGFVDAGERHIRMAHGGGEVADTVWKLSGAYNLENALAAVAAADSAGVPVRQAVESLSRFEGVKRRLERTATVADVAIYDDFAHHPTAIERTITGLKKRFPEQRIVVALEPRSNTMKMGVHKDTLGASLDGADLVFIYRTSDLAAELDASLADLGDRLQSFSNYDDLVAAIQQSLLATDQLVFMSNGGFGGARQKLTAVLKKAGSKQM
jgi:UDP-N-acetylmuramate: L-alanyl-gamma-D-glutamyl-meso-diaminopimelate ligase